MPIDSELNALLSVLALSDATKAAVVKGLPTCEDLEYVFLALAADKTEVEAMLRQIVDEKSFQTLIFAASCLYLTGPW
jgi:D-ribose pyranose/furanose isomerase RbsD